MNAGSLPYKLDYQTRSTKRRRLVAMLAVSVSLLVGPYLYSYYGWIRTWEGEDRNQVGVYSLNYWRAGDGRFADLLEWAHGPLRWWDHRRYIEERVYQVEEPYLLGVPEFKDLPGLRLSADPSTTSKPSDD